VIRVSFLFGLFLVSAVSGFSQTGLDKVRKVRENTLKEIELANKMLEETKSKTKQSLQEIDLINEKLKKRQQVLLNLATETAIVEGTIEEYENQIRLLDRQINALKSLYAKMVIQSYKRKWKDNFIIYLMSADNMNQFYQRIRFFKTYSSYIKSQKLQTEALKVQYLEKKEGLLRHKAEKDRLLRSTRKEVATIQDEGSKKRKLVSELKGRQAEIEKDLKEKERLAKRLDNEMTKILDAERRKTSRGTVKAGMTPVEQIIATDFEKNRGRLPWPTQHGIITGKYGEHQHPDFKSVKVRNDGIYISTLQGESARAIFKGVVSKVFSIPGQNYTVIIRHGSYFTLYHNLTEVRVKAGQNVDVKEVIGKVFTDPETKETTLYFQVWKETERSDPEIWLAAQ